MNTQRLQKRIVSQKMEMEDHWDCFKQCEDLITAHIVKEYKIIKNSTSDPRTDIERECSGCYISRLMMSSILLKLGYICEDDRGYYWNIIRKV